VNSSGSPFEIEKHFSIGFDVPVQPEFACLIKDTEIHFSGMKVDSAMKFALFGVKFHPAFSFGLECFDQGHFTMPQQRWYKEVRK
jgi:hypothetical protein